MRKIFFAAMLFVMLAATTVYAQNETFDYSISSNPSTGAIIPVTAGGSTTINFSLTLVNGTTQPATFSCSGAPGGGSCSFSPSSCSPPCSSTMTISTPSNTTTWTYTYLAMDSSGGGAHHGLWYYSLYVSAQPFDYSVSSNPSTGAVIPVTAGNSATITVNLNLLSGTTTPVSLIKCYNLPSGASCSFSPTSCNPTCSSTVTISTTSTMSSGTYSNLGIQIYGGGVQHDIGYYSLVVSGSTSAFDFSSSLNPTSGTVTPGSSTTTTIGLTLLNGTTQPVTFSCSPLPAEATCSFSPSSCSPPCSSTVTISTSSSMPAGTYYTTIGGSSSGPGSGLFRGVTYPLITSSPCAGVTCNSPPPTTCDGNNVRLYYSPGTCNNNGICTYKYSTSPCQYGCQNGACNGTETPLQNYTYCSDSDGGRNYNLKGVMTWLYQNQTYNDNDYCILQGQSSRTSQCSGSDCVLAEMYCSGYLPQTESYSCPNGCFNGACNPTNQTDLCANVVCNSPPSTTCDGSNVISYYSSGKCNNGICSYSFSTYSCPYGCGNGVCKPYTVGSSSGGGGSGGGGGGPVACPAGCQCKYDGSGNVIATYCTSQPMCNYNGVCDKGEDAVACKDCVGATCPVNIQCPDGTTVPCYRTDFGCKCDQCPIPTRDLPLNCRQETDSATGFVRVICEQPRCSVISEETVRIKCSDNGGIPVFRNDPSGCQIFDCQFGNQRAQSPVFATPVMCPSPEEVSQSLKKCEQSGLQGFVSFENGCKIGKCLQEARQACGYISESQKKSAADECGANGGQIVFESDQNGCQYIRCSRGGECQKDLPKEVYASCGEKGGQFVVRRDNSGCVAFSQCLTRGDESQSFVENVKEVPDSTELLSIAFKLEDLKIQLEKLAKKTNDIADYYRSIGSGDETRFRRVSDMFSAAKDKVDEIRTKLRDRANAITTDDVLEIKQDLRYIKDVMLKDILFVMLSSGTDVEEIKNGTIKNCRTDSGCFDRAFRVCQPLTFRPEDGISVEVKGLEGDTCIMHVVMSENKVPAGAGISPPYEMTCKIQNYALGVRNPQTDIFPFCTGNIVNVLKNYTSKRVPELQKPVPVATRSVCTGDVQCGSGFSCWKQPPVGAFAGVRGSAENPGSCYDNNVISQTV